MSFTWHGVELPYFDHPYNTTRLNERAVEVPIVREWLGTTTGAGLEVGNVLSHYGTTGHRVVDLYERAPGVDSLDVFDIAGTYDWIVAISTLEHVRWDPPEARTAEGAIEAVWYLLGLLNGSGRMIVTIPLGHHPHLDDAIRNNDLLVDRDCVFARDGDGWIQHDRTMWKPYGATTKWAETVWIGEWSV